MTLIAVIQSFFIEDAQAALHFLYPNTSAKIITYHEGFNPNWIDVEIDDVILLLPYVDNDESPEKIIDLPQYGRQRTPLSFYADDSYVVSFDGSIHHNRSRIGEADKWQIKVITPIQKDFSTYMGNVVRTGYIQHFRVENNPMHNLPAFVNVSQYRYRGIIHFHDAANVYDFENFHNDIEEVQRKIANYATLVAIHKRYGRYRS